MAEWLPTAVSRFPSMLTHWSLHIPPVYTYLLWRFVAGWLTFLTM